MAGISKLEREVTVPRREEIETAIAQIDPHRREPAENRARTQLEESHSVLSEADDSALRQAVRSTRLKSEIPRRVTTLMAPVAGTLVLDTEDTLASLNDSKRVLEASRV
jgi:hypothetical protein